MALSLGIELVFSPIENAAADIERAIESFARVPNGGLVLPPDSTTNVHRELVIALAAQHRLPAVYTRIPSHGESVAAGSTSGDNRHPDSLPPDRLQNPITGIGA